MKILKIISCSLLFCSNIFAANLFAKDSNWGLRLKSTKVMFSDIDATSQVNNSDTKVSIDSQAIPELDIIYYINDNISLELPITAMKLYPVANEYGLGRTSFIPASLIGQYHFTNKSKITPYIGVGAGYAVYFNGSSKGSLLKTKYENEYFYAAQFGFDVEMAQNISVGLDVRHLFLDADTVLADSDGNTLSKVDLQLNPTTIAANVKVRF